jgi:hypothetical protein
MSCRRNEARACIVPQAIRNGLRIVSKNDLSLISGSPVKFETSGERAPEFSQSFDRFFPPAITGNLEFSGAGHPHFDLVTFL